MGGMTGVNSFKEEFASLQVLGGVVQKYINNKSF